MSWTRDSTGAFTHSGTTDESVMSLDALPANTSFRVQIADPAILVQALVLSTADGRTCYRIGTDAGTGGNILISKVSLGGAPTVLDTTAHGLTTGVPFFLEVRVLNSVITTYLNGSSTATSTYDASADTAATTRRYYGFRSAVNGARVLAASVCTLVQSIAQYADILFGLCDGDLYASINGAALTLVARRVFTSGVRASLAAYRQKVYGVGGGRFKVIDPVTMAVTDWTQAAAAKSGAGGVAVNGDRIGIFGDKTDPQNITWAAIGDPTDFNTASGLPGQAYALNTAGLPGLVGQPIHCVQAATNNSAVIGCTGSIYRLVGDPAIGGLNVVPLTLTSGVYSQRAMTLANEGVVLAWSPDGLFLIGPYGMPVNLSNPTLTQYIQVDRALVSSYTVNVIRDAHRHFTHIFLTAASGSVHVGYDERVGHFDPELGGFFLDTYPENVGPLCAVEYMGHVLLGGRDGYFYQFDEAQKDDDGTAINCTFPLSPVHAGDADDDTFMGELSMQTGLNSDQMDFTVYGALTAEGLYDTTRRWPIFGGNVSAGASKLFLQKARAPWLLVQVSNARAGQTVVLESAQAVAMPVARRTGRARRGPIVPPVPSGPPVTPPAPTVLIQPYLGNYPMLPGGMMRPPPPPPSAQRRGGTIGGGGTMPQTGDFPIVVEL